MNDFHIMSTNDTANNRVTSGSLPFGHPTVLHVYERSFKYLIEYKMHTINIK